MTENVRPTKGHPPRLETPTALMQALPGSAYRSARQFLLERDRIFHRDWFLVGREEMMVGPGDYLHADVAGESVLVVRTRAGELRGFFNVCRHRGSQLVMDEATASDEGSERSGRFKGSISCPYHAWTYGLEGELRVAPFLSESDGLHKENLGLRTVAVQTWGGFVFVNLAAGGSRERSLPEQLGEAIARTRNYSLEQLRIGARLVYDVAANWKVIVENFNECYHCGPVHPELCELVPVFKQEGGRGLTASAWEDGIPHRDGATTFTLSGTTERAPLPGLSEHERVRHKGELIYPNVMLSLSADHVAAFTLWPVAAHRTRIVCDFLFHPTEIARPAFDPNDAVEFWDLVNLQDWRICESVQRGMGSRSFTHGYYAPMEDLSLDIRRYVADRLGGGVHGLP
jgi:phenylpropionate dioxygenase-like ring-hydroxylating dioxygenase large terminal subunit